MSTFSLLFLYFYHCSKDKHYFTALGENASSTILRKRVQLI